MLRCDQELIDRFNVDEHRWRQSEWWKRKRRLRFWDLSELQYLILDMRNKVRERRMPVDCVSRKGIEI